MKYSIHLESFTNHIHMSKIVGTTQLVYARNNAMHTVHNEGTLQVFHHHPILLDMSER